MLCRAIPSILPNFAHPVCLNPLYHQVNSIFRYPGSSSTRTALHMTSTTLDIAPKGPSTQVEAVQSAPTLTPREKRLWGKMGEEMTFYHNRFRVEFTQIYKLADSYEDEGMSLHVFLGVAQGLHHHLNAHHTIEERYIFPILGRKMPEFDMSKDHRGEHLKEHEAIHEGLDRYDAFLAKARSKPSSYSASGLRETMDSFSAALFKHLDAEVDSLSASNMKKYWSEEEMRTMPM